MSSDKYCADMVKNFEETLSKKGLRIPMKCNLPIKHGCSPEMDCTGELKSYGLKLYQELIGYLRWDVEIIRVEILLETSILSKHLALPCEGHLEQVLHIVGYLKSSKTTNEKFSRNMIGSTSIKMQRRPYLPTLLKQGYMVSLSHVLWMLIMEGI